MRKLADLLRGARPMSGAHNTEAAARAEIFHLAARVAELETALASIASTAASPMLMTGWWPVYAEAHGVDAAWRELAMRVHEAATGG
jgi:hypothetical protein